VALGRQRHGKVFNSTVCKLGCSETATAHVQSVVTPGSLSLFHLHLVLDTCASLGEDGYHEKEMNFMQMKVLHTFLHDSICGSKCQ
jgi:hypothetical protein